MAVNLSKGQRINLQKSGGGTLSRVFMGLGWDAKKPAGGGGFLSRLLGSSSGEVDLDASCLLLDGQHNLIDTVWFRQLETADRSITHSGDNRTGAGDGDDEVINIDLTKVSPKVHSLVFVVNSFTGQTFNEVEKAYCRLVDASTKEELARYELGQQGSHTGQVMARLYRQGDEWTMQALGEVAEARTFHDLVPLLNRVLSA